MWAILCLACSHLIVGVIVWNVASSISYRRGLDDAWMDYAGESFPQ